MTPTSKLPSPPLPQFLPEVPVDYTAFLGRSTLLQPEFLESPCSAEHLPLIFWLVEALKPRLAVDLGASDSSAFFALCQAAEVLSLDTEAILGAPGFEVSIEQGKLERCLRHLNDRHVMRSRFIGGDAESVATSLATASVDLLLLHVGAASAEEMSAWVTLMGPKLSSRGVIFVDGIGIGDTDPFISLDSIGRNIRFNQGDGCAIIITSENVAPQIRYLFALSEESSTFSAIATLFKRLGLASRRKAELQKLESTSTALSLAQENLAEVREELGLRAARLVAREAEILELRERCEWLRGQIAEKDRLLRAATQSAATSQKLESELRAAKQRLKSELRTTKERLETDLRKAKQRISNLLADRNLFRNRLSVANAEKESLLSELQVIRQSRSWRATAPLREILHRLRVLRARL